jgi:hypothetical protein
MGAHSLRFHNHLNSTSLEHLMAKFRIALTSNYDFDNFTESFLNAPLMPESTANVVAKELNTVDPEGHIYYRVVPNSYVLRIRES